MRPLHAAAAAALAFPAVGAAQAVAYAPAGNRPVATWDAEWHDAARQRTVPVRIHYPAGAAGAAAPVVVFSHGLGGSREMYGYLGACWAARGYVSVHVQHAGSDLAVLREAFRHLGEVRRRIEAAAADTANYVHRPADVRFVLDELARRTDDADFPLRGRLDLAQVGVAGHSFGAYTVLALAGQAIRMTGQLRRFGPDPRIAAGIAMSSDPAPAGDLRRAYDPIRIPVFHMTGTRDQVGDGRISDEDAVVGNATAAERRLAYDHTRLAPAYLLTFAEGDHRVFSGRRRRAGAEHDAAYQALTCTASAAFWDATLRRDPAARAWLEEGGFAARLGTAGTFEWKRPPAARRVTR